MTTQELELEQDWLDELRFEDFLLPDDRRPVQDAQSAGSTEAALLSVVLPENTALAGALAQHTLPEGALLTNAASVGIPATQAGVNVRVAWALLCSEAQLSAAHGLTLHSAWPQWAGAGSSAVAGTRVFLAKAGLRAGTPQGGKSTGGAKPKAVPGHPGLYIGAKYCIRCYTLDHAFKSTRCAGHMVSTVHQLYILMDEAAAAQWWAATHPQGGPLNLTNIDVWECVPFSGSDKYKSKFKELAGKELYRPTELRTLMYEKDYREIPVPDDSAKPSKRQRTDAGEAPPASSSRPKRSRRREATPAPATQVQQHASPGPSKVVSPALGPPGQLVPHLSAVMAVIKAGDVDAFAGIVRILGGEIKTYQQLQEQDVHGRPLIQLLLTPTFALDAQDYFQPVQDPQPTESGESQLEMLRHLCKTLPPSTLVALMGQCNTVSRAAALHTAARWAASRTKGQEMLSLLLDYAPLDVLVQTTKSYYLPLQTAARCGDVQAATSILGRAVHLLEQAGLPRQEAQVLCYECGDKYFQAGAAGHSGPDVLRQVAEALLGAEAEVAPPARKAAHVAEVNAWCVMTRHRAASQPQLRCQVQSV